MHAFPQGALPDVLAADLRAITREAANRDLLASFLGLIVAPSKGDPSNPKTPICPNRPQAGAKWAGTVLSEGLRVSEFC